MLFPLDDFPAAPELYIGETCLLGWAENNRSPILHWAMDTRVNAEDKT